jgi:Zn-finger nucleic acid-binding protein
MAGRAGLFARPLLFAAFVVARDVTGHPNMAQLTCPKCDALFHRFERSGVVIERCTSCRGVFLDQGELEHLIEVEGALLYSARPGRAITDENPTTSARPRGKRKIPVTERILDLG